MFSTLAPWSRFENNTGFDNVLFCPHWRNRSSKGFDQSSKYNIQTLHRIHFALYRSRNFACLQHPLAIQTCIMASQNHYNKFYPPRHQALVSPHDCRKFAPLASCGKKKNNSAQQISLKRIDQLTPNKITESQCISIYLYRSRGLGGSELDFFCTSYSCFETLRLNQFQGYDSTAFSNRLDWKKDGKIRKRVHTKPFQHVLEAFESSYIVLQFYG